MKKDYSEYQPSKNEMYNIYRSNRDGVELDYFQNIAVFDKTEKSIRITVDNSNEYYHMYPVEEEYYGSKRVNTNGDKVEDDPTEFFEKNEERRKLFASKFDVDFSMSELSINQFHIKRPDLAEEPLLNIFSGTTINLQYGEGILDFIYADFKTPADACVEYFNFDMFMRKIGKELRVETKGDIEINIRTPEEKALIEEQNKEKIYNSLHATVEDYSDYTTTFLSVKDLAYASLYSAICPPVFQRGEDELKQIRWYGNYLLRLQQEYKELIEFCFDENFYPEILSERLPTERFYIYRKLKGLSPYLTRKEEVAFSNRMSGTEMPYGMTPQNIIDRLSVKPIPNDYHKALAEKYQTSADRVLALTTLPTFLSQHYTFGAVADILELEFTKMLEHNVRFRKCKRCGKYFIMKGNYDTNYCDRIAEGETRNCQDLAAQENYKKKMADNAAIPMYQKYYKRYSARVRVKQIKEDAFKKWKYQAITKRDECSDGIITLAEFEQWLENSFPNRKKKD